MRYRKAAAGDFLDPATHPGYFQVPAARKKFNQLSRLIKKQVGLITIGESYCDYRRKVAWPFPLHEISVVAGGYYVAPLEVGFIDPVFVLQDMIFTRAAETAV